MTEKAETLFMTRSVRKRMRNDACPTMWTPNGRFLVETVHRPETVRDGRFADVRRGRFQRPRTPNGRPYSVLFCRSHKKRYILDTIKYIYAYIDMACYL